MKLNPVKCTFGITSGEFLGYIMTQRGIEANPKHISTILDLPNPKTSREIQPLTGRVAALNRFISRSTNKFLRGKGILRVEAIPDNTAAVSSALIKEDRGEQHPIFYASKRATDAETRYPTLERMALAVVTSARTLRPYFQSHSIVVLTDLPLRTTLQNANQSRRFSKWAIELSEYDISYKSRPAIKAQVLADFLVAIPPTPC
ncbi:hypothetical protein N665_0080s0003 [Sinapis alba]|nr:hypothetical protein N665_0080s0003 [Sinapis alba]